MAGIAHEVVKSIWVVQDGLGVNFEALDHNGNDVTQWVHSHHTINVHRYKSPASLKKDLQRLFPGVPVTIE